MFGDEIKIDNKFTFSTFGGDEAEFIPLMTPEDEQELSAESVPEDLPILPIRNTVLFPGVVIPITVGRDKSIRLINDAYNTSKTIGVIAQRDGSIEDPNPSDLYEIGTVAKIIRMFKMPDGNTTIIIQGKKRFEVSQWIDVNPYLKARVVAREEILPKKTTQRFKALIDSIKETAIRIIQESPNLPSEAAFAVKNIESEPFLVNFISSNLNIDVRQKQDILEEVDLTKRANMVLKHLINEMQMLEMKNQIQNKVKTEFDQQQREYFLYQQMKTIQEELGGVSAEKEVEEFKARAKTKKWSEDVSKHFEKEIAKLQRANPQMPEYSIQRNYIELLLDLPWGEVSKDNFDLKRARKILDRDHYGLSKVKDRIIEYLAVLKLKGDLKAPILCFYGPPGVGKTSLGRSIADALGRKYSRISLGGLRDEAEIRGHRKTYIGAMPGRIIQNLKKVGFDNPVFVLDEIDKLSYGMQGDPSSAMLEVLDPEQNKAFYDNYLELGYDLSKVLFIATANDLSTIQPALRDRMEIIELNGYTLEEKYEIAHRHLIPKQLKEHGLDKNDLKLSKPVIERIIDSYTRESGVRNLEKTIAKIVRNIARKKAESQTYDPRLTWNAIREILGPTRFDRDMAEDNSVAGVVTGLAWTPVGGDILFIESTIYPGSGKLSVTGNLGDVMKESATIALAWIKANARKYQIDHRIFSKFDIHIHVPEGATPKDGPSAGVTMLTALISLLTQKKVRKKLAMTGEITLRGKVLPVGGIKEKILAAKRSGISDIILCKENEKDILEIEKEYISGLNFHFVTKMSEVIELALTDEIVDDPVDFSQYLETEEKVLSRF
ncbi:MAG: endopeptidase La [Thermaurantimonas sp.]